MPDNQGVFDIIGKADKRDRHRQDNDENCHDTGADDWGGRYIFQYVQFGETDCETQYSRGCL